MLPIINLLENCEKHGSAVALEFEGQIVTYDALARDVRSSAQAIARRCSPGDRVALICANSYDYIRLSLAIELAGALRVPVNVKSTPAEAARVLADCTPAFAIYEEPMRALLPEGLTASLASDPALHEARPSSALPKLSPDQPCSITYTSGSTGDPKGVVMSHANWFHVFTNMLIDRDILQGDRMGFIGPLTHAGWSYLYAGLWRGTVNVICRAGDTAGLLARAARAPIHSVTCVPTTMMRLMAGMGDGHLLHDSLRWIGVGGAPITQSQLDRALATFGGKVVVNYGQTEAMMTCTFMDYRHEDHAAGADHIGRPYVFSDIRIADADGAPVAPGTVGEICIRGPHCMIGYWNRPDTTRDTIRDGFVCSGDLGLQETSGLFRLVGRAKEMIISGGFNIYPMEVENVIATHNGVAEVAVIGIPDKEWGERVVCFVAPEPGTKIDVSELVAFAKDTLGIKAPKDLHVLDILPKSMTGKIDKKALRASLGVAA